MAIAAQARSNPYVGPRAFTFGEKFYGRDREVRELLDLLLAERIVLLYSPSGAGKTSLIEAGLKPRLEEEGFQAPPVMRVSLTPRQLPQQANRYALSLLLSLEEKNKGGSQKSLDELAEELAGVTFEEYLGRDLKPDDKPRRQVLIFDQFEEILTSDPAAHKEREEFFEQVGAALRSRQRWALFAMREEYRAGLDPYLRPIPTRLGATFRLDLLGKAAALEAIQRPASDVGVEFTSGAANKLVEDLSKVLVHLPEGNLSDAPGQYVEPVQLQVVCLSLWGNWVKLSPTATKIEADMVTQVGDVDSALGNYYDIQVKEAAAQTQTSERKIRDWFHNSLITKSGIRGQVLEEAINDDGISPNAIRFLDKAHLIRPEVRRKIRWYELSHDRLIKPVQNNNAEWYRDNLSLLQRQVELWDSQGRAAGLLLRGDEFHREQRWAEDHKEDLTNNDLEFLKECRREQEKEVAELELKRRKERYDKLKLFAALLLSFGLLLGIIYFQKSKADKEDLLAQQVDLVKRLEEQKNKLEEEKKKQDSLKQAIDALNRGSVSILIKEGKGEEAVKEFEAATAAMVEILKVTTNEARKSTRVAYFYKPADGEKVSLAISALNFTLEPAASDDPTFQTSLIWFGDKAPIENVKLLALTLLRNEIQLKFIRPYSADSYEKAFKKYQDDRLHTMIGVGGANPKDIKNNAYPEPITVEKIMAMTETGLTRN